MNFTTDGVQEDYESNSDESTGIKEETDLLGLYIAISIFFVLFGTLENSAVIYLFTRKHVSYAGNAYVKALAVLDILACTFLLQTILFKEKIPRTEFSYAAIISCSSIIINSYVCILAAMSLERLMAVTRPIKYGQMKGWHKYIVTGLVIKHLVIQIFLTVMRFFVSFEMASLVNALVLAVVVLVSFCIIIASYTIIIHKLLKQNKLVDNQPKQSQLENAIAKEKRARHVTTVKVFVGVTILFLVSYMPVVVTVVMINDVYKHTAVMYMINHVGNPIIYYALNKKFREDANALGRNWLEKCRNFASS